MGGWEKLPQNDWSRFEGDQDAYGFYRWNRRLSNIFWDHDVTLFLPHISKFDSIEPGEYTQSEIQGFLDEYGDLLHFSEGTSGILIGTRSTEVLPADILDAWKRGNLSGIALGNASSPDVDGRLMLINQRGFRPTIYICKGDVMARLWNDHANEVLSHAAFSARQIPDIFRELESVGVTYTQFERLIMKMNGGSMYEFERLPGLLDGVGLISESLIDAFGNILGIVSETDRLVWALILSKTGCSDEDIDLLNEGITLGEGLNWYKAGISLHLGLKARLNEIDIDLVQSVVGN